MSNASCVSDALSTYGVVLHQLITVHLLGLVERDELDVLVGQGLVGEGTLNCVKVVCTNGRERSLTAHEKKQDAEGLHKGRLWALFFCYLPANVVVQFVLEINEAVVAILGEGDVAQDGTDNGGADLLRLTYRKRMRHGRLIDPRALRAYLGLHRDLLLLGRLSQAVVGCVLEAFKDAEGAGDTLLAEQVISIRPCCQYP